MKHAVNGNVNKLKKCILVSNPLPFPSPKSSKQNVKSTSDLKFQWTQVNYYKNRVNIKIKNLADNQFSTLQNFWNHN